MAESGALIQGLACLLEARDKLENAHVGVYTDSRSICTELESIITRYGPISDHNGQILELLFEIATLSRSVSLNWIPGHSQIGLNEHADTLADEGHNSSKIIELATTRASFSRYGREVIQRNFISHLQRTIQPSRINPNYPNREIFKKPWAKPPSGFNSSHRCVFKLLTGHTTTGSHRSALSRFGAEEHKERPEEARLRTENEELCRFCKEHPESVEHVILHCSKLDFLQFERNQLWLSFGHHNIHSILTDDQDIGRSVVDKICYKLRKYGFWI